MHKNSNKPIQLFTVQEAAKFLGVNSGTIRRWAQNGQLKGIKVGTRGDWRFKEEELLQLVSSDQGMVETKVQFFQNILSVVPALIAVYNISLGKYIFVSKSIAKMLGYSPEEFIEGGLAFVSSLVHPEDLTRIMLENEKALQKANAKKHTPDKEPIVNFEYRMKHKNGTWRWLHTDGSVYDRSSDGKVKHVLNVSIDVTKRKEAELRLEQQNKADKQALSERRQQLQAIIDESPAIIFVKDLEGKYLLVNKRFEKLFKITMADIVGKTDYDVFPRRIADKMALQDRRVLETNKSWEFEEIIQHADGRHVYISIKFPLYDTHDKQYALCGVVTDITERKKVEQRKENFISVASHELKTPVTSMKIFAQVLKKHFEKVHDEKALELLAKLDKQINKQTLLISDLLDFAKIQTGRFQFHNEVFEIDDLIRETVESMQGGLGQYSIKLEGQTGKAVFADRDRVGQVLINLLTNAVKYSPQADSIIVHSEKNKEHVLVSVQDFGIGIPEEAQKKIFERFFRVEGGDERTYPGFGIGLYVCSEIIKRHGGKIWVESKRGKGSTFFFTLPVGSK